MTKIATTAAKTTKPRAPRKSKIAAAVTPELSLGMSTELALDVTGDPALDALMAELNGVSLPSDDEVILPSEPAEGEFEMTAADAADIAVEMLAQPDDTGAVIELDAAVIDTVADPVEGLLAELNSLGDAGHTDDLLSAAVSGAEMLENYDKEATAAVVGTDAVEPKAAEATPAKEKKAKGPKEPKAPRTFFGLDKLKRLTDRGVAAVMLKSEEELTGDDLNAAQQRTLDVVAKANQKVKNRTANILEYVTGKTNTLNNLIRVCFNLVEKDGILVTGEKGNMWAQMSACYDPGTIRSGGNNSVAALRDLQLIVKTEKGYVKNPDSALYERVAARLAAGTAGTVPVAEESLDVELPVEAPVSAGEVLGEALTAIAEEQAAEAETPSEVADAVA
jgi:hypothetical protein